MTLTVQNPNRVYSGLHDRLGRFLLDLKADLLASGLWEVTGSGDGDQVFANQGQTNGPFDVLTASTPYYVGNDLNTYAQTAVRSISRGNTWIQLKEKGSTRTLQFRRGAAMYGSFSEQYNFRFCPGGVATTGAAANACPAPVGPYFQSGGDPTNPGGSGSGFIVGNTGLSATQTADVIVQILTATSARAKGVCPFAVIVAHAANVKPMGGFFYESLVDVDDADLHPYIIKFNNQGWDYNFGSKQQDTGPFYDASQSAYGAACATWAFDLLRSYAMPGTPQFPSGQTYITPPVGGKWKSATPRVRIASGVTPGVSEHFLANFVNREYPDTFNLADTAPWVAAGNLLLPWKQNTTPIAGG